MRKRKQSAKAFWSDLKGLKDMVRHGFPQRDSAWTSKGRSYCSTLARKEYAEVDPKTGKKRLDPEAFISSPQEAKEVLKRQGRWGPDTEIEAL